MIRDKLSYLSDMFNWVDMFSFGLNIYIIDKAVEGKTAETSGMISVCAIAAVLLWFKSFYWLRMFGPTSFYVRMIVETLFDISSFLILFILILMTFGNAMLIMSTGREEPLYSNYFDSDFANTVLN